MNNEEWKKYEDIIELEHHVSFKNKHATTETKAGQFAPFATLRGHDEAVLETARLTDEKIELDEEEIKNIDNCLRKIKDELEKTKLVEIVLTYFRPDNYKEGGAYITIKDKIKKIDDFKKVVILEDGNEIEIDDLFEIEII